MCLLTGEPCFDIKVTVVKAANIILYQCVN